jgi:hypothetical protein
MTRLENAAIRLHRFLWNNVGDSDDWLVTIKCADALRNELVDALNELGAAVEEVQPGSNKWPV